MKFIYWLSLISILIACQSKDAPKQKNINTIPVVVVKVEDVPIYNEFVGQTYGLKDIPIRARVDGYIEKIDFDEGWVHLRKSNTEPIVRFYSEAGSQSQAEQLVDRVIAGVEEN